MKGEAEQPAGVSAGDEFGGRGIDTGRIEDGLDAIPDRPVGNDRPVRTQQYVVRAHDIDRSLQQPGIQADGVDEDMAAPLGFCIAPS